MLDRAAAVRLGKELEEIDGAVEHILADVRLTEAARDVADVVRLRSFSSALQDFYSAVEDALEKIAPELNGGLPESKDWHSRLLRNMAMDLPGVRPAVIDAQTERELRPFLRLRHRARNIYGFDLDAERIALLVSALPEAAQRFRGCLRGFLSFLGRFATAGDPTA